MKLGVRRSLGRWDNLAFRGWVSLEAHESANRVATRCLIRIAKGVTMLLVHATALPPTPTSPRSVRTTSYTLLRDDSNF